VPLWWAYLTVSSLSWLCSAVFHARDTPRTERLDYLGADAVVAVTLFVTCARVFALARCGGVGEGEGWARWGACLSASQRHCVRAAGKCGCRRRGRVLLGAVILAALAAHVRYMLAVRFDYGWNMQLCVVCGVTSSALWLGWAFSTRHPARCEG